MNVNSKAMLKLILKSINKMNNFEFHIAYIIETAQKIPNGTL